MVLSKSPKRARIVTPKRRHQRPFPMPESTLTKQSLKKANQYLDHLRSSLHNRDQSKTVSPPPLKAPSHLIKESSKPEPPAKTQLNRISTDQRRKLTQQKLTEKLFQKMNNVREFQTTRDRKSFNFNTINNPDAPEANNMSTTSQMARKKSTEQSHRLGASPSYAPKI